MNAHGDSAWLERRRASLDAIPPVERRLENGVLRVTRRFRGLTPAQAVRYLEHLGGVQRGPAEVVGEDWRAAFTTRTVPVGPSYRLTEIEITWTGRPDVVDRVVLHFRLKAFRAPG
ncbi:hypothetical protein [Halorarius halobius]|uniref:hypothetical protein n=1 Tax=Halorarius halobius TaxID=2962671 RepID=UPI0020CE1E0A|nr:hypothetical protein [Halorarius halobius]